jgi:hypothetical protein
VKSITFHGFTNHAFRTNKKTGLGTLPAAGPIRAGNKTATGRSAPWPEITVFRVTEWSTGALRQGKITTADIGDAQKSDVIEDEICHWLHHVLS